MEKEHVVKGSQAVTARPSDRDSEIEDDVQSCLLGYTAV
jgi:hypothetical protein